MLQQDNFWINQGNHLLSIVAIAQTVNDSRIDLRIQ